MNTKMHDIYLSLSLLFSFVKKKTFIDDNEMLKINKLLQKNGNRFEVKKKKK